MSRGGGGGGGSNGDTGGARAGRRKGGEATADALQWQGLWRAAGAAARAAGGGSTCHSVRARNVAARCVAYTYVKHMGSFQRAGERAKGARGRGSNWSMLGALLITEMGCVVCVVNGDNSLY